MCSPAKITLARQIQNKVKRNPLNDTQVRIAYVSGALPYMRQAQVLDYFTSLYSSLVSIGYEWQKYNEHSVPLEKFEDVGGFTHCPEELLDKFIKWLLLAFLGEASYGRYSTSRPVFYSNSAASVIKRLFGNAEERVFTIVKGLDRDTEITAATSNMHIARRYEMILDLESEVNDD